ncbi:Nucleotidyltransferase [Rhizoclosmatium globosum]|uniref:polynucleotide adenylyltransferase n=1 Tax=Rhizoclosmatium globosum TaxID=329046 RepID=A0A1Y2CI98_9FUNG|nr:Nucleotidyltransferase [Rhizoclosmatium globosum]|eukprot:ORY46759.1 Nucleotidyltransferase [Rhizoclosmatium globosum]
MDGFGDEEDDLTAQDKKKMEDDPKKFRDRDPLDLVYDLPRPVWANRQYSSDLRLMFNQEVQDYHSIRHLTIERLRFVVAKLWPHATVQVFGSFSTKLYLPTSDVDIVIILLFELSVALRDHKYVSKIEVIAKARVPIIKYVDALTTFPVDISINMDSGPQAAQIVTHFLQEPNGVGEAIRGLMYLLNILELYGRSFSYFDVGIMCDLKDGVGYFSKHNYYPAPGKRVLMLTPNDVGCGAFNFQYIKTEFFRASQKLVAILGAGEKRHYDSLRRLKPHQRHHSPRPPPSILSAVVSVRKGLYEYRRGIADLWRRVESGEVGTGVEEDVWNQVCEGLKQYEQERRSLAPKKRSREAEEGEVISSRESVVPVQPDSSPAEPQAKKVHLVGYDSEEEVDGLKMSKEEKERRDWKLWEKEYFNVLQEAKDELGASDVSLSDMQVSSGEEGEISNKPRKKQVVEVEVEERKGDSRNPLKKK